MITLRPSESRDASRILDIWSKAVDATHGFLLPADRVAIGEEVEAFLPQAPLTLAVDVSDRPLGFMFLHEGHMEALFIDPDHHGQGIGKVRLARAMERLFGIGKIERALLWRDMAEGKDRFGLREVSANPSANHPLKPSADYRQLFPPTPAETYHTPKGVSGGPLGGAPPDPGCTRVPRPLRDRPATDPRP